MLMFLRKGQAYFPSHCIRIHFQVRLAHSRGCFFMYNELQIYTLFLTNEALSIYINVTKQNTKEVGIGKLNFVTQDGMYGLYFYLSVFCMIFYAAFVNKCIHTMPNFHGRPVLTLVRLECPQMRYLQAFNLMDSVLCSAIRTIFVSMIFLYLCDIIQYDRRFIQAYFI